MKNIKNITACIFFSAVLVLPLQTQISLLNEEMVNEKYRLTYANSGFEHTVVLKDGKQFLSFSGTEDELSFPSRDLFIALPPNSTPSIVLTITKQKPFFANGTEIFSPPKKNFSRLKGYLWIGNSYCAHIVINPFISVNNRIEEVREFRVEIGVQAAIQTIHSAQRTLVDGLIANPTIGAQWEAQQPVYAVKSTDSWIDYNQDYVKLGVAVDGIYRISYSTLASYGVPVGSIVPNLLKIYMMGKEIPIYVRDGNDNSFDEGDYIEFLGRRNYGDVRYREIAPANTSYYEYLNRYSDTTIYWLHWSGSNGMRIDTTLLTSGIPVDTMHYYDELIHRERDVYWDFSLSGGDLRRNYPELLENETWNEGTIGVGTSNTAFTITDLYPNRPARAFVKLQDFASSLPTNAHNLALALNSVSTKYDSGFINKYQVKVLKAAFSSSLLVNGTNTVTTHSFTVSGNSVNTVIQDWQELEYPRYLRTAVGSLSFAYNNLPSSFLAVIAVSGLSSDSISLYRFKLIDSSIIKITNYIRSNDTLRFADSVANGNYYFLLPENKIPSPIFFYKKKFVNLRAVSNKADYIAITHPYFQSLASNYVSFIASTYGVAATLINIFDICDEYNYGFWSPEPIKEFLKSTHAYWQSPKPKYVLLLGKGTYDYYGNKQKYAGVPKVPNFVPPFGNPVSDTWFVQWDSTGSLVPQMSIGRIPAKNIEEFQSYFVKHQNYVTKGFDEWNKRYLFFSGGSTSDSAQIVKLKEINDSIIFNYVAKPPIGGTFANFYKTTDPVSNFGPYSSEYVTHEIEQGGVFISYIGHSGTQTWDNTITSVTQLENIRNRNPMISDFGCSTGKFAESDIVSFSELAVNDVDGQAIAYIGNSSLGFTSTAFTFPLVFYKKLLVDTSASLGDVHRLAKNTYINTFGSSGSYGLFIKTNALIGDPIVKLPIPTKPNYTFNNAAIVLSPERGTDQMDSVSFKSYFYNLGVVPIDSLSVLLKISYGGSDIISYSLRKKVPLFLDSITVTIPVKQNPGEYTVTVLLDPQNVYDEIAENDNVLTYSFVVASTNIRSMALTARDNQTSGKISFLNPSAPSGQNFFIVDISLTEGFATSQSYNVPYDTFYTSFYLAPELKGNRVWVRTKHNGTETEGLTYSYIFGNKDNILYNDSIAFSEMNLSELEILSNAIVLDTAKVIFKSISAGFNDGNTAVITKNAQNFIPENTVRGFHVCVFNALTYDFKWYFRFDVQANESVSENFKTFLDTLSPGYLVIIAISNDVSSNSALFTSALKTSIKQYGSQFIDSVEIADSWTIIGLKGAAPGSVPEKFLKRYNGLAAVIDTTILVPNLNGMFNTKPVGPAAMWNDVQMKFNSITGSDIVVNVFGVKNDNQIDTLINAVQADSIISLEQVNAVEYPQIFVSGNLKRAQGNASPILSSIELNYKTFPELGTNYQTVETYKAERLPGSDSVFISQVKTDTVIQGKYMGMVWRVYNVGEAVAKNVKVQSSVIWDNNFREELGTVTFDSLLAGTYKEVKQVYNSSAGTGSRHFQITIDPENVIREIYKDNNFYSTAFVVIPDTVKPLLTVTFDGVQVVDGDYVSRQPVILISYKDNSPAIITPADTNNFRMRLNNSQAYFVPGEAEIVSSATPGEAHVRWTPLLDEGENLIRISTRDGSGNYSDTVSLYVSVSSEFQLRNVYNLPNPFNSSTRFTFTLAGPATPDEVMIKLYTVAGRLIHEIHSFANIGFNNIYWDGRDKDGDEIGNGVYLYRVIVKGQEQQVTATSKLVKMK